MRGNRRDLTWKKEGWRGEVRRRRLRGMMEATIPSELECSLCLKLLYEPISLSCGHTFCRRCLRDALQVKEQCALCRRPCHKQMVACPPNVVITAVTQKLAPEVYRQRKAEEEEEEKARREAHGAGDGAENEILDVFLFNQMVFPNEPVAYKLFEPRYVLMIERCLAGNRQFAMQGAVEEGSYGSTIEILTSSQTQYGHYLITGRGKSRYKTVTRATLEPHTEGLHRVQIQRLGKLLSSS